MKWKCIKTFRVDSYEVEAGTIWGQRGKPYRLNGEKVGVTIKCGERSVGNIEIDFLQKHFVPVEESVGRV
jgi:hypothetical protein